MHYDPTTTPLRAEADLLAFFGDDEAARGNRECANRYYDQAGYLRILAWARGEYDDE